jgi:integrase
MAAYLHRRRSTRKAYVYYTDPSTKTVKQLPRALTKHLDNEPDSVAEAWIDSWAKNNGINRDRIERKNLKDGDKLLGLWKQYQEQKASDFDRGQGRREKTIEVETARFLNHIVPFFVEQKQKKDPAHWAPFIPEFHTYLANKNLNAGTRRTILWILKRFGESMVFNGYLPAAFAIRPPRSKNEKVTPLKVRKNPEEIIEFAKSFQKNSGKLKLVQAGKVQAEINYGLAVLLGYFGGFGPGELYALEKGDLLTGEFARSSSKTLEGFRAHGLGSSLAVVINKTLPVVGDVVPLVKNDYRFGVSNIWNVEAAKLVAKIVSALPEGRLFPYSYGYLTTRWRADVFPQLKATPHDLRRASGLYLGRVKRLEITLLQEHMRHAEVSTTMLYCREPSTPEKKQSAKQDFDDVA